MQYKLFTCKATKIASLAFSLATCFILGQASNALAAEEETPKAATVEEKAASKLYQLPTITVTADKRTTDVQKTPTAITVMTDIDLEDAQIDTVEDVLLRIPNLYAGGAGGGLTHMSFRGIPTSLGTFTSPVIIYIDDIPTDPSFNMDAPLLNIERIEILRGAQSAVYGKNALGGVINIISRKPDNEWHTSVSLAYGEDNTQAYSALVNGPIIEDKLFFSLAAMHNSTDGWMNNLTNGDGNEERAERFKGQLRFTPTEDVEFTLHASYLAKRNGFTNFILGDQPTLDSPTDPDDNLNSDVVNLGLSGSIAFDSFIAETITTFRNEELDWNLDMDWQFNGFSFHPVGANAEYFDAGRTSTRTEFTQEFRLKSPDNKLGLAWLVGLFGGYTDMNLKSVWLDAKVTDLPLAPGFIAPQVFRAEDQPSREYTEDYALFAEATYPVTDAFKITGALRGQYTQKSINLQHKQFIGFAGPGTPVTILEVNEEDSWLELLPKLAISYELNDDIMIYAGINRSFIPGGFNNVSQSNVGLDYDSQTAWNYEIGTKTEWFDNRLLVNLAVFYSDIEDFQTFSLDIANQIYISSNAGAVESYGIELDAMAKILPGLDAEFNFGYTHAELKDYIGRTALGIPADYSGNKTPLSPEYTASFALQYRHDTGIFVRGEVLHTGTLYWADNNLNKRDPITLLNARIGYEFDDFGIYVYANNLTNEKYLEYYSRGFNVGNMARPREVGTQVTYRF